MPFALPLSPRLRRLRAAFALLGLLAFAIPALAQTAPAPEPAPPAAAAPAAPAEDPSVKPSGDASGAQAMEIAARPVALIRGSAKWDDGFGALSANFAAINAEIAKAGLAAAGRPMTVFVETDDDGFRYEAMVPLAAAVAGKDQLSAEVKLGNSPAGKVVKFQHRAAYSEIDGTYEAITAYLDEKGLEAQNLFVEEYLTDPTTADDDALQVDIYVFVK